MFGTSGIRGPVGDTVTASLALSVGRALASEGYERVVVGRDVRETGDVLVDAVSVGLREGGSSVVDVGVASTPTIARGVEWCDADAGVAVTASHNPPPDNGLKLWTPSGKAFGPERRRAIARRVENDRYDLASWDAFGRRYPRDDLEKRHRIALRKAVELTDPPSVVVDPGNGTGGITARTLVDLECSVRTIDAQPDGRFPARPSEPKESTLESLRALLANTDAEVGIAHDGDADRMMAVDERGRFVPKDVLLAIFATASAGEGDRVAVPVDTSLTVEDTLVATGAEVVYTPVGDGYVAERAAGADVVFGGEPSGAWIWPSETLCPDGPLAACKLVELVDGTGALGKLADDIDTYPIRRQSIEIEANETAMETIRERARVRFDEVDTLDGVRVTESDGWFLVRASGTQPLVRVTAEGRNESTTEALLDVATSLVENTIGT